MTALTAGVPQQDDELAAACERFINDPLGFVRYFYDWGHGELEGEDGPDVWQTQVLEQIAGYCGRINAGENPGPLQIAIASGHGIGKSALVSWIVQWFASCRDHPQIVVTANTETQLATKTWREMSRWHKRLANTDWFEWTATKFALKEHPQDWFASAIPWSTNNPEAFAGTHEKHVLVVFDEASKIDDVIWEKVDGAMSTKGAMWICFGNPTRNHGRFYDCFHKDRKWWQTKQIDSRTCKKADQVWAAQFIERVGITDDRTKYQILGQFPSAATRQYISTDAVKKAQSYEAEGWQQQSLVMGVDIARFGENSSVLCLRRGRKVFEMDVLPKQDLMTTAHYVAEAIKKHRPIQVFVDGSGIGAGVVDRLRQLNFSVVDVNGGASSLNPRFLNKRAEMWTEMKEFIEGLCELPKDKHLAEELTCVSYGFTEKGRIKLQRKEDIMDEYGFSPDRADALALTFAYPIADFTDTGMELEPRVFND